jgi:hypothetical protein
VGPNHKDPRAEARKKKAEALARKIAEARKTLNRVGDAEKKEPEKI